jgi:hypothetical protein
MLEVCDIVEYLFGGDVARFRVTHHLKRVEDSLDSEREKPADIGMEAVLRVIHRERERERAQRKASGMTHARRYRLNYCRPEEATHVELVGVCGAIAAIGECRRIAIVDWDAASIARERKEAVSDFWLKSNHHAPLWMWE